MPGLSPQSPNASPLDDFLPDNLDEIEKSRRDIMLARLESFQVDEEHIPAKPFETHNPYNRKNPTQEKIIQSIMCDIVSDDIALHSSRFPQKD